MGETLTTITVIVVGIIVLFVFPLIAISEMQANEVATAAQAYATEFLDQIRMEGKITNENYGEFQQKLYALGNSYDVNIEVQIPDVNPGKKSSNTQIGDTTYYSEFTKQIEDALNTNGVYYVKEGAFIIITYDQTNTDIHEMLTSVFYGVTGEQKHSGKVAGTAVKTGF